MLKPKPKTGGAGAARGRVSEGGAGTAGGWVVLARADALVLNVDHDVRGLRHPPRGTDAGGKNRQENA